MQIGIPLILKNQNLLFLGYITKRAISTGNVVARPQPNTCIQQRNDNTASTTSLSQNVSAVQ